MTSTYRSGPFRAFDLRFEIEVDDRETSLAVARTFECMRSDESSGLVYEVRTAGAFSVSVGKEERRFLDREEVLPWLLWRINHDVVASVSVPVIHGAAATYDGSTVICCGHSGAGKSTLAAGLVSSGFSYVTDEAVACEENGLVRGWTRPLALHRRSLDILEGQVGGRIRGVMPIGAHGEHLVRPDALGPVERGKVPTVGTVIFLGAADDGPAGDDAGLVQLGPAAASVALSEHVLAPSRRDENTLRSIAAIFDTARAWKLHRRPLPEMVELVGEAVHQRRSVDFST